MQWEDEPWEDKPIPPTVPMDFVDYPGRWRQSQEPIFDSMGRVSFFAPSPEPEKPKVHPADLQFDLDMLLGFAEHEEPKRSNGANTMKIVGGVGYWLIQPIFEACGNLAKRWWQPRAATLRVADQTMKMLAEQHDYPGLSELQIGMGLAGSLAFGVALPFLGFPISLNPADWLNVFCHYTLVQLIETLAWTMVAIGGLSALHVAVKLRQRRKDLVRRAGREPWHVRWIVGTIASVAILAAAFAEMYVPIFIGHTI